VLRSFRRDGQAALQKNLPGWRRPTRLQDQELLPKEKYPGLLGMRRIYDLCKAGLS